MGEHASGYGIIVRHIGISPFTWIDYNRMDLAVYTLYATIDNNNRCLGNPTWRYFRAPPWPTSEKIPMRFAVDISMSVDKPGQHDVFDS